MEGACHCGAVRYSISAEVPHLMECNCSLCSRLGALWIHGSPKQVTLHMETGATLSYSWGDRTLAVHSCKTCGCTTHWTSLQNTDRMAVNGRLIDSDKRKELTVRHFDGADTWTWLD